MSGSTTELNLRTAVDSDDNADYLTLDLANSLRSLDALFNNVTGHTHGAAHQGGPIVVGGSNIADGSITSAKIADGSISTLDLADGAVTSAKIAPPLDLNGWFRSRGPGAALPTSLAGLEMFYDGAQGIVQSYDRSGAAYRPTLMRGSTVTLASGPAGALSMVLDTAGNLTVPGTIVIGTGDLSIKRASGTEGCIYFVDNTHYLYFNTAQGFTFAGGGLSVNGAITAGGLLTANAGLTVNGVATHAGATSLNGTTTIPLGVAINWQDANSQIYVDASRHMYLHTYGGNWYFRNTATGFPNCLSITAGGDVQALNRLGAGTLVGASAGDLSANRGNGTGYVYLGSSAYSIGQDGSGRLHLGGFVTATNANGGGPGSIPGGGCAFFLLLNVSGSLYKIPCYYN